ncbi:hypothetical protein APR12_006254 [Nocardia amikacinitolerans]|uniref:hypothetical protein n=1 Tax=Nocardia amikacinitolerans TaxID=756689 RepID=UPI00082BD6BB|nr:hypothetical protein [Nocardia amikacinitolerans]MCP2320864.1 hypothetical protein [Nocardia amikacinitolerans]
MSENVLDNRIVAVRKLAAEGHSFQDILSYLRSDENFELTAFKLIAILSNSCEIPWIEIRDRLVPLLALDNGTAERVEELEREWQWLVKFRSGQAGT